ncbi:MAG: O-antigen ligase family protein [Chloracidobacterium sp.]|nr:O-antigen ligase family protein [Chloracidobacterium sp.]
MKNDSSTLTAIVEWTFLVLVFSLAFMRPTLIVLGSAAVPTDLIFLVCLGLFAVSVAFRRAELEVDSIYLWLGLYGLALTLSALFSIDVGKSLRRLPAELYLIALAALTINIVRDERMLIRTLAVWVAAASVAAAVTALTAASFFAGWQNALTAFAMHHYGTLPPGNYPRIQGTFEYPAMLCNYLAVGLMLLLAFWRNGSVGKGLFYFLLALFSIAIFFTLTPGIGGVLAAVGLWFYCATRGSSKSSLSRLALVGVSGMLAAFVIISSLTPFGSAGPVYFSFAGYDITPTARLLVWQQALGTIADHPLFGVGLGLPVVDLPYRVPAGGWTLITDAHNVALNVAAQAGVIGLGTLAAVVVAVMRRTQFALTDRMSSLRLTMGIAFVSCFLIQGFAGSFENARHLWVLIGLIVAADRINQTKPQTEELHA